MTKHACHLLGRVFLILPLLVTAISSDPGLIIYLNRAKSIIYNIGVVLVSFSLHFFIKRWKMFFHFAWHYLKLLWDSNTCIYHPG